MFTTKEYLELIASRRRFVRTDNFNTIAKISDDNEEWSDIAVSDVSAGGLLFRSFKSIEVRTTVWFDLLIKPILFISGSPLVIKTQGEVLDSRGSRESTYYYAAKFTTMSPDDEMALDVLIQRIYERYGGSNT